MSPAGAPQTVNGILRRVLPFQANFAGALFAFDFGRVMTLKNIIIRVLKTLDRGDIAATLEAGAEVGGEAAEKIELLIYCVNAVEDELARYYFPLKHEQTLLSDDGKYGFEKFAFKPVKILSVTAGGKNVKYTTFPQYIFCGESSITVCYEYTPPKRGLDELSAFDGTAVGESLIAAGAAAEYCLICGSVKLSETWEGRYRREIDSAREKYRVPAVIPPRRWV